MTLFFLIELLRVTHTLLGSNVVGAGQVGLREPVRVRIVRPVFPRERERQLLMMLLNQFSGAFDTYTK